MRPIPRLFALLPVLLLVSLFFMIISPAPAQTATLLYKSYVVRKDRNRDILCDPYIVQQNDYVYKLFRNSGEIAQTDFPEFLAIFSRLNPQVRDIDLLQAGEHIIIPLKKIAPNSLPDQQSGFVTIPFVSLATIPDSLKKHAREYKVKRGDTVINLLANTFGKYGSSKYEEGVRIFQRLNPGIENPDHIVAGQSVWLPAADFQKRPLYAPLFNSAAAASQMTPREPQSLSQPIADTRSSLQQVADLLEAQLLDKGTYYFPRTGNSDFKLNLAQYPVLEFSNQQRVMFAPSGTASPAISETDLAAATSFWKNLSVVSIDPDSSTEKILDAYLQNAPGTDGKGTITFSDNGVRISVKARWWFEPIEPNTAQPVKSRSIGILPFAKMNDTIPAAMLAYLAKHGIFLKSINWLPLEKQDGFRQASTISQDKIIETAPSEAFVATLLASLNISYAPNVAISFPYGDIQVPAVSNLLHMPDGRSLLMDFGSLNEEAVMAIEKTGLKVIQLSSKIPSRDVIERILNGTGLSFQADPHFSTSPATMEYGADISIPGYLVSLQASPKILFSMVPLDPSLVQFLAGRGLDIFQIASSLSEG